MADDLQSRERREDGIFEEMIREVEERMSGQLEPLLRIEGCDVTADLRCMGSVSDM